MEAVAQVQSAQLSSEELAARAAEGRWILLRTAVFDPLNEGAPAFARGEAASSELGKYVLAQFSDDLSGEDWKALLARGARILSYIPSHAYIVRIEGEDGLAALLSHRLYRWHGPYAGGYKISPLLAAGGWTMGVFVDFKLFPGENPVLVRERLLKTSPEVAAAALHGTIEEGVTLRLFVPAGRLHPFLELASEEPAVLSLDPWFLPHIMNNASVWVVQNYDTTNTTNYALSATMWNHGVTGTGQTPAVSDTGCDSDMCFFRLSSAAAAVTDSQSPILPGTGTLDPTKKVIAYYVLPNATAYDGNTSCNGSPESWHGTHVCGSVLGDNYATLSTPTSGGHDTGDGMAPNAKLIFQDAGSEATGCMDGLSTDNALIFQQAYNAGARIHSNSWGGDTAGVYTSDCQTVDRFIYGHEDFQFFFANGNAGSAAQTVGSPATAKNCVSVGATVNGSSGANSIASYSSRGPTADGRRKPDVCTPGSTIVSASGTTSHTDNNCGTKTLDGTSMATPTAAGAATLLREYLWDGFYPTGVRAAADALRPSAALLKAALVNGAVDISLTTQAAMLNSLTPNNNQGFGRVVLDTVCFFSTPSRDTRRLRLWDKLNATGLTAAQIEEFPLQVTAGQPLKVTLVWTDPESTTVAALNLVNNLDLEVVAPDGSTTYKGNVFASGQSTTGGLADALNNVEEVFITAPTGGTWTLRVKATAVPGAPSQPYSTRQGFALVATYADCTNTLTAPASLTATDNATTGVDLAWSTVSGATRYQIYRASGDCSAGASEFHYLAQTTGTAFTDTIVQGGFAYAYKVRAADTCAEGGLSPCATATYTGNCTLYPTFGGVTSAQNDTSTATCDIVLGWSAGTSNCPQGASVTYNVYRGTSPYLTVGPSSRIVSGVAGITYRDSLVDPNTTYYYIVRAEDGTTANGGPANGGNEDLNTATLMATPTAATFSNGTWADAGGDSNKAYLGLGSPWRVSNQQNHTPGGAFAYHAGPDGQTYPSMTCASATTPSVPLQAGQTPVLTFWERFNLEYQWDGVVVEISDNGGAWTQLAITPDYPQTFSQTGSPPVNACAFASTVKCFSGPNGNAALSAWTSHTANLSAYAGHNIQIRWRLSSDPGLEFDGFYLDDISITYSATPDDCTLCANNPTAVDVAPDGPLTLCTGSPQTLTANITGGAGPFTYQWTRDGADIGGASSSTYNAGDTGTHSYNCKVWGNGCANPKADASSTQITWQSAPTFAGVSGVTNPASATCTLNLAWTAGTAYCGGPVYYNVYRSTAPSFTPGPANRIATGVTTTTYADTSALANGTAYYYIVRAVDASNSAEDANAVTLSGTPTGSVSSSTPINQNFATGDPPAGWTLVDLGSGTQRWTTTNPGARTAPSGITAPFEIIDSDFDGVGVTQDDSLISPAFSCVGATAVSLTFDTYFNWYSASDFPNSAIGSGVEHRKAL